MYLLTCTSPEQMAMPSDWPQAGIVSPLDQKGLVDGVTKERLQDKSPWVCYMWETRLK